MSALRTALQAALLAAAVALAAYAGLSAPKDFGSMAPIWVANALPLVLVLRCSSRRWPVWVAAGFVGNLVADLLIGDTLPTSLVLSGCNTAEVLISGLAIRRLSPRGFDPGRMQHLAAGAGVALAASFVSAAAASTYLGLLHGRELIGILTVWTLADTLGLVILVPCLLILADWRRYAKERPITASGLSAVAAVMAVECLVFAENRYPLLFLAPVAALSASLALETLGAAIIVLMTAAVAIGFTLIGSGPIVAATTSWTERMILLQVFVAAGAALNLQAAAMQQQRRAAARELVKALAEAEEAARVKAEFLANMSHEIRTPLTSILGFASLLADRNLGEEPNRHAGRVLGASRNLLALVNDILDFSKLEAGGLEIKPRAGCPEQCGRDVVELFATQAMANSLRLTFQAENLPPLLTADFDRVRQVLMNLVGNAVKFTQAGSVTLRGRYDAATATLGFLVIDTGPGVDSAGQEKLFKRFSQVDAGVNRAHGGSGLGLAISKGLVEAMGGRIGLESRPGEGSTFWLEIPAPLAEREVETRSANFEAAAFVGLKVLLVDDNVANRELINSLLSPLGVALAAAEGGEAAVALCRMQEFQLILMDLRMPGVDGWTAARAIRSCDGPNVATPMLAFSADISAEDEAVLDVFQGVVRKPVEMVELLHTIAQWAADQSPQTAGSVELAPNKPQQRR